MKRNIVLIGFMGTGKSTVARAVATRLDRPYIDMDMLIEEREGMKISDIFAEKGEPYFRQLERTLTQELSQKENQVIAPGGGIVLNPENVSDFSRTGLVICLVADPETILHRIASDTHRPLLERDGDKMQHISDLLEKRRSLYEAIPLRIDTTRLSAREVADRVIALSLG